MEDRLELVDLWTGGYAESKNRGMAKWRGIMGSAVNQKEEKRKKRAIRRKKKYSGEDIKNKLRRKLRLNRHEQEKRHEAQ